MPRHPDVHQHDVGPRASRPAATASSPSAGLADDLDVVLGVEQRAEPGADERLVVGEQRPGSSSRAAPRSGSRARDAPAAARRAGRPRASPPSGRGPLAHPAQAVAARAGRAAVPRARAVVGDLDADARRRRDATRDGRRRRAGVAQHVGQRLLHDPVAGGVDRRRDARRSPVDVDGRPRCPRRAAPPRGRRGRRAPAVGADAARRRPVAQHAERRAQLAQRRRRSPP